MRDVRVVSVPTTHPYVDHITRLDASAPPAATPPAPWQASPALDPDWLAAHRDGFDLLHLHFGFEGLPPGRIESVLDRLRSLRRPLVYTVHDLTNPHLVDQSHHAEQLDLLIRGAAALITLTPGAAAVIEQRWGRDALVLPHPHVAPLDVVARPRPARVGRPVVGVHLKSLRPSTDTRLVAALLAAAPDPLRDPRSDAPGFTLRVDVHAEAMRPDFVRHDADLAQRLTRWAEAGRIQLAVHPRFSDDELWEYLQSLDVAVLPYRTGTHSGWVEACYDLGTAVVAPALGHWAEQHPVWSYATTDDGPDPASLAHAVATATGAARAGDVPRADAAQRDEQRRQLAGAHASLYRAVTA